MHPTLSPSAPVFLFSRAGKVTRFESKADALRRLGYDWISSNVSTHFTQVARDGRGFALDWYYPESSYILRDREGRPLTAGDFNELRTLRALRYRVRAPSRPADWVASDYSGSPVPHTAKRRGGNGYWRYPRTLNESRLNQVVADEEPRARGKRTPASLPTAYDDLLRSSYDDRCWKRYRKTQWKG